MLPDAGAGRAELIQQELAGDLMSPYCPGRTIASCPSPNARKLEDYILELADQGKSREEIETILVERFGSDIVGYQAPPAVLYGSLVVGLVALGGLGVVARRWVRRSRTGAGKDPGSEAQTAKPSRAELDALDDALDQEDGF